MNLKNLEPIFEDLLQIADHHMESQLYDWENLLGDHPKMIRLLEELLAWVHLQKAILDYKKVMGE